MKRFEGTFRGMANAELFYQVWSTENPRGTILVTHGLAEHSECYHTFAKRITSERWNVWGWDLRGHGKSEGKRGFVENFAYFVKDLDAFIAFVRRQKDLPAPAPLVLFGHSMGGLITTRLLLEQPVMDIAAVALSSPAFGLKKVVPKWKVRFAESAVRWMPSLTLNNEIVWSELTRDAAHLETYDHDPLRHDRISPAVFLGMREGFDFVLNSAKDFRWPLCMQLGGLDPVVNVVKAKEFYENCSSDRKQLFVYADSLHEIFNDLEREAAFEDLKTFLAKA